MMGAAITASAALVAGAASAMTCESEMRRVDDTLGDVADHIGWAFPAGTMTRGALEHRAKVWRKNRDCAYSDCDVHALRLRDALIVLNAGTGGLHLEAEVSTEFASHVGHLADYMRCLVAEAPETEKDYMAPVLSAVRADSDVLEDWVGLDLKLGDLQWQVCHMVQKPTLASCSLILGFGWVCPSHQLAVDRTIN